MKLRTKFQMASASLVLVVVAGVMGSMFISEKKKLFQQLENQQKAELSKFSRVCDETYIRVSDQLVLFKYAKTLAQLPLISYAGYTNQSQSDAWIQDRESLHNLTTDPWLDLAPVVASKQFLRRDVMTPAGENIIEVSQPVGPDAYVILGYSRAQFEKALRRSLTESARALSVMGLIAIVFGLLLAQLLSAALAKPIDELMKAARAISHGEKGVQVPVHGKDELGKLATTFNEMSHELTKLDALKDDFMSHVTHELRSPLTSIIATVELLAEMPQASKDPKFRRSIDRLIYGSERLNRLVDNILDLTRMEAGKMPFDIQPVNVSQVICEMADFFEPRAMEKGLKINAMAPGRLPLVMADSEKIRQVLSNLIYNAIKFTNAGGIVVWAKEKDGFVQIGVQDTGVGIPKDKIAQLFKKFECLKDTRDRVNKPVPGTGLGLVIVKNSIQAQGGTIWVESEMNKGSTFVFTLPMAPAAIQAQHATANTSLTSASSMLSNREGIPPKSESDQPMVVLPEEDKNKVAI